MSPRPDRALLRVALSGALALSSLAAAPDHRALCADARPSVAGPAWLGVSMETSGAGGGARVLHVVRGSPAEKGGVKVGDLIRALDGLPVSGSREVTSTVLGHLPGDVVVVSIVRDSSPMALRVTLDARPAADAMARMDHVGAPAPAWVDVQPLGDAPSSLARLRGKVVLIDFWATWCGPCRLAMPRLSALQARYGAQGLQVIGLTADPIEQVAEFTAKAGLRYPVAVDTRGATSVAYGVSALPTLYVIDKRGVVRDVASGYDPDADVRIEALLRQLLSEPATAP